MHNKNVITVENNCHNIPEMLHDHEHRLIQLEADGIDNVGYVSNYMEYYTDNYSPVIQNMINKGVKHIIFNLPITYHFKSRGTDAQGRNYCVAIVSQEDIIFEGCSGHTITYDYAEDHVPNLFSCHSCQNLEFKNLNFEGINTRVTSQPSTPLYTGSAIYCFKCKNVNIHDINSKNVIYQVLAFNTSDIDIRRTYNCHDYYNQPHQASTIPYAFIQCHSCYGYSIDGCTHYGGCRDGDIGIFGGGGTKARVSNNRLMCYGYNDSSAYPYNISQAICNDQGCENAIIEGNFIDGYYFGVDMKADVRNCICTGNVITNCKIYIADRRGESQTVYQTQFNHIINNMIILQDNYVGNDYLHEGMYYMVGILCENRQGCHIENNTITLNLKQNLLHPAPCLGIYYSQEDIHPDYQYPSTITNNHIIYTVGNIGTVLHAHGGSTMIHIKNIQQTIISHNTFKGSYSKEYMGIKYQGTCKDLTIQDNRFWMNGHRYYKESNSELINTKYDYSERVQRDYNGYHIQTGDFSITGGSPTSILNIGMNGGVYLLIKIRGCADYSGLKYVDATFTLNHMATSAQLVQVAGIKTGYDIGIHYATWGVTIYVTSDTDSPLNRFEIDVIEGQYRLNNVDVLV